MLLWTAFARTKIVFWDLRGPFIDNLYKPSVSGSRMEALIEPLDVELNQLCDIIVEPLRDRIVTSLLQASLDGFLRVILDGGPSRVFIPGDAKFLEEDLEVLKPNTALCKGKAKMVSQTTNNVVIKDPSTSGVVKHMEPHTDSSSSEADEGEFFDEASIVSFFDNEEGLLIEQLEKKVRRTGERPEDEA
ncbi:protein unc-13-like protein isoform X1 [Senna tora]|uniref:Protein unc-13-like protein isoform X1 n=1 Tax=Senna tora TaxID=362788 RepID=A0A834WL00_9FABA|nr:protein unc-13-like protein isoform X1 [Senna tora]